MTIMLNRFTVREPSGELADVETIAQVEEWARGLMPMDMEGFALTDAGELILLDECGNYRYAPSDRFDVEVTITIMEASRE